MHLRSICAAFAAFAFALPAHGMSRKPGVTVRFHTEANSRDGDSFSMPIQLHNLRRSTYLGRVPDFSEKQIKDIFPFEAGDGTWGCVFRLDAQGRIRLESLSNERRGSALVVFVATKTGQHQVVDMIIDREVSDGVITVPRGLTALEVLALRKEFKQAVGETKKADSEKKNDSAQERIGRPDMPEPPSRRRGTPEPDLPRLAD